jgi:hypothetical protein
MVNLIVQKTIIEILRLSHVCSEASSTNKVIDGTLFFIKHTVQYKRIVFAAVCTLVFNHDVARQRYMLKNTLYCKKTS